VSDDPSTPTLTAEQTAEVFQLIKRSDTVELKLTVPDTDHRSAVAALEMDVLQAQIRQVMFFDTPELTLNSSGLVLRARRVQGREGDSVVKLRPIDPADVPSAVRKSPNFGIEVDAMPGGFVCSGSMKARLDDLRVKETVAGARPISKVFTKEQRQFFEAHAPADVQLNDLARLGPINVLKLKFTPGEFGRRMVAELWFYPDGSRLLELSTKCLPAEAFQVAGEAKAFLVGRGIDLAGKQATKTRTALEYFAGNLAEAEELAESAS
jgi:hypothetical protein